MPTVSVGEERDELNHEFQTVISPFVKTYCTGCHGKEKPKAKFDLSPYVSLDSVAGDLGHWRIVLKRLAAKEMPSKKAKKFPDDKLRQRVIDWIQRLRRHEAKKNAGDPGPVLARRLSNAEYDYSIHDLTGTNIRPTREFPVDPANKAGFDNSGESLTMSPALLTKYLAAARRVADHLVLLPNGLDFAPHPVVIYSDRDKFCVHRIVDFYKKHPVDYADYFLAAWRYRHRAKFDMPDVAITDGEANREGFWHHAKTTVPDLRHRTSHSLMPALREWGCERYKSGNVRGVRFPTLADIRQRFDTKHGRQEWDDTAEWD